MSVFAPAKLAENRSKVHHSQYIQIVNEDKPDEDTIPTEPVTPDEAAAEWVNRSPQMGFANVIIGRLTMSKDKGRKAIKKPKKAKA